ncbi:hypothetical protein E4U21_001047 [Claviceps maximensis]|nr:hypothetical protein E4U21_001047 [Claviceps maximensis]
MDGLAGGEVRVAQYSQSHPRQRQVSNPSMYSRSPTESPQAYSMAETDQDRANQTTDADKIPSPVASPQGNLVGDQHGTPQLQSVLGLDVFMQGGADQFREPRINVVTVNETTIGGHDGVPLMTSHRAFSTVTRKRDRDT